MSIATNVTRRGAVYYTRMAVPLDLQDRLRKKELWKSLRTTNPKQAKRLARSQLDKWDAEFTELRCRRTLTETDLQDAVWSRYVELVEADESFRETLPTDEDLDAIWQGLEREFGEYDFEAYHVFEFIRDRFEDDRRERATRLKTMREHAARGETKLVADVVQRALDERRLEVERGSRDYRRLALGLQRAELEALARAQERDRGDWGGAPRDKLVAPPMASIPPSIAVPGESIMDLFERYARENLNGVKVDTLNQSRMAVALFADTLPRRFSVAGIDKKVVRDWKALLERYPVKAAEIAEFRGLSMRNIVQKNEQLGKPTIGTRTINRYLSGLGAFCKWLVVHDYLARDPVEGMHAKINKKKRKTLPFSTDQLNALFRSPLFIGCLSDDKMHRPGNVRLRDHRYWLPLVMLYTGARPSEIAQLLTNDVRELHGQWIIHITEEGDETKSTKTEGSMRIVPVHPELVRLGFIAHAETMRQRGERRLFPEAERNQRGQMAAKFSREFGRYLVRIGMKSGRGLSLYSFRHVFVDALRRAEYLDEHFGFLVGHAKPTTTGQYGIIPQGMLRQRVEMIKAVHYPGLDLTHLYVG